MRLADLEPLEGIRKVIQDDWLSPNDRKMCFDLDDPNHEAFSGRKYDDYGGYGKGIQPVSIIEVGTAWGYSLAAMILGAGGSVKTVQMVDIHADIWPCRIRLQKAFPEVCFEAALMDTQTAPKGWPPITDEYDIVSVDADHTYEGCLNDLRRFGPLVSERGIIVVDDAWDWNVKRACIDYRAENDLDWRFIENHNGHYLMQRKVNG